MTVPASSTSEPGQAAPQLLESLRKAGVKDLPSNSEDKDQSVQIPETAQQTLSDKIIRADTAESSSSTNKTNGAIPSKIKASEGKKPRNTRKSVSFTADTKKESLLEHKSKTKIPTMKRDDTVSSMDGSPEEEGPRQQPIIPPNESPEDAALRRQMIQYNMAEVNNIVAEMNLEDEASDGSYSGADSEDIPDDSSLDEDEDKFGRTKRRVLSDEYLAEMRALEQKLNAKAIQNVGPDVPLDASAMMSNHEKGEQPPTQPTSSSFEETSKPPSSKSVRFAKDLDIQPSPPASAWASASSSASASSTPPQPPTPPKSIHTTIIERPYNSTPTAPAEPDDLDPALLQQQVKTEYHKMRNRMIQREGGFTDPDEESAEVPLTEAEGGPKKMSRFKAARLGRERQN